MAKIENRLIGHNINKDTNEIEIIIEKTVKLDFGDESHIIAICKCGETLFELIEKKTSPREIRIVCATNHLDSNEIEIVLEKTVGKLLNERSSFHSVWIDVAGILS